MFCGWFQWFLISTKSTETQSFLFFNVWIIVGCRDELAVEGGACAFQSAPHSLQSSKTLQWRRQRSADSQPAWTLQSVWKMLIFVLCCNSFNVVLSKMAAFLHVFLVSASLKWLTVINSLSHYFCCPLTLNQECRIFVLQINKKRLFWNKHNRFHYCLLMELTLIP